MTKSLFSKQFLRVVWIWAYKVFERSSSSHHNNFSNLDLGLPVLIGVRVRPNSQFSNSELGLFSILRIRDRKCQRIQILRFHLSPQLSWTNHLKKMISKARARIGYMFANLPLRDIPLDMVWRVFQKSNNYKITVLRYGCLCVFICLGAYWGQTKQNWRLLCKHQLKKISSLNSWCNLFLKKVLIINRYSCLKIKNVAFNSLMSNL